MIVAPIGVVVLEALDEAGFETVVQVGNVEVTFALDNFLYSMIGDINEDFVLLFSYGFHFHLSGLSAP
jgi:hypothetical protein